MGAVRTAGAVVAGVLAGVGVLHAVWAVSPWPMRTPAELADAVVGRGDEMPPPAACLAVAGALGAAAYLVGAEAGVLPAAGPARVRRAGVRTVSAVLLARGTGGLLVSALGLGEQSARFRRLDARYYSPLCLALGAGAGAVAVAGYREPDRVA
ncbi:DUF3995 domain-containing protein [Kitasatospora sp. CM 4170]|uniref:DUF3995 domain-containing protein n=1 Tax=Kitasatospora aburaviensis TaxID=67265 RepID=A0ABW1F2B0_9ACTN|nr:DUF3995 domain-containing protein [Kitasatospora sp. CM 4170]WNM45475.1 DUF3995 domain-containing protein [Kitasatospora sp. CM 4170]